MFAYQLTMKKLYYSILLLCLSLFSTAQIIPEANLVDWSDAGYPGNFPEPATVLSVMDYGAVGDGVTDDRPAVLAAIAALNSQPGVVLFPAGSYKISSTVSIPSGVVLRGEGVEATFIKLNMGGSAINGFQTSGSINGTEVAVISGYTKGSTQLVIDGIHENYFAEGDYVELRQTNGTWDTNPATWATYSVGQVAKITAVAGTTITLNQQLRIDYDVALNPHLRKTTPITNVGIECMNIQRVDEPVSGAGYNILFSNSANCWVKGIESNKSVGSHVMIENSTNIEVRSSYFHDAFTYDGSGTRGYGVTLNNHSGQCLIENNAFKHLRHAMMVKHGANGNVFGYNYSLDPFRSETPADAGGDISVHGHFPYANLFEGNIIQTYMIDHYWGPAGPYNTFFRNRTELYGIIMTNSNGYDSNLQNLVGNETPNTGLFMGNYIVSGSGHIQHGNNIRGTITPAGTEAVNVNSYYLNTVPDFWTNSGNWPTIGFPNTLNTGSIPAKIRYDAGGDITLCNDDFVTDVAANTSSEKAVVAFPNPFSDGLSLSYFAEKAETVFISLQDISGKTVFEKNVSVVKGKNTIPVFESNLLKSGMYFLKIQTSWTTTNLKIICR
ncbi:MAG: hypothetical protein POELPBGB_01528 [Bacteroidia bacterium]|nr:hypothetical protein [Bacteroidia bacterium]